MYPLKENSLSEQEKIEIIQKHFESILDTLWLDLTDDSIKKTPYRVAKMYVKEIFSWLNNLNRPKFTTFENKFDCDQMVLVNNIKVQSCCEHHLVPFIWTCSVAYIPDKKVVGLSKINRIVDFYARKPQVQERLVDEIYNDLVKELWTQNVAIKMTCKHYCVIMRWVKDVNSDTTTSKLWGIFREWEVRAEFLSLAKD